MKETDDINNFWNDYAMNALDEHRLSLDTQAILLLCGQFGKKSEKNDMQPLAYSEYVWLDHWLQEQHLRPAELLDTSIALKLKHLKEHEKITPSRLLTLLMRKPAMTGALEHWSQKGLWIMSEHDPAYPRCLKTRLGQWAPPLLYGVGHCPLLQKGGIAIISSHDIDKQRTDFTKKLAKLSAQQNMLVMSNGTRGVEMDALLTALAQGRCALGVLNDHLLRTMMSNKYHHALQEERLALISPFGPETVVSHRIVHNRCLYGLADVIVIVKSLDEEGEPWIGAVENLKMKWAPLFVYQDEPLSLGNQKLLEQGGVPIDNTICHSSTNLRNLLLGSTQGHETKDEVDVQKESSLSHEEPFQKIENKKEKDNLDNSQTVMVTSPSLGMEKSIDLFDVVWPHIEDQLSCERTEEELAECLNLHPKQLKIWLQRALELGKVIRLNKPTRYMNVSFYQPKHPSLF